MFNKQKQILKDKANAKKQQLKNNAIDKIENVMPKTVRDAAQAIKQNKTENGSSVYRFDVAGTGYHQSELESLGTLNDNYLHPAPPDEWEKREYKYSSFTHSPCALVFEPTNKHDKNAIMVLINGVFIGYVPAMENLTVGQILKTKDVKYISARIFGGDCIVLTPTDTKKEYNEIRCTVDVCYK